MHRKWYVSVIHGMSIVMVRLNHDGIDHGSWGWAQDHDPMCTFTDVSSLYIHTRHYDRSHLLHLSSWSILSSTGIHQRDDWYLFLSLIPIHIFMIAIIFMMNLTCILMIDPIWTSWLISSSWLVQSVSFSVVTQLCTPSWHTSSLYHYHDWQYHLF